MAGKNKKRLYNTANHKLANAQSISMMKKKLSKVDKAISDTISWNILLVGTDPVVIRLLQNQLEGTIDSSVSINYSSSLIKSMTATIVIIDIDSFAANEVENFFQQRTVQSKDAKIIAISANKKLFDSFQQYRIWFLSKPFRLHDLLAQIKTLLPKQQSAITLDDDWDFQPIFRRIKNPRLQKSITLTEKETAILQALKQTPAGLTQEQLLYDVWGYQPGIKTQTLAAHIYRLRRKLSVITSIFIKHDPDTGTYCLLPVMVAEVRS